VAKKALSRTRSHRGVGFGRTRSDLGGGKRKYTPIRTGRSQGTVGQTKAYPDRPGWWTGSLPEWAIYWAHTDVLHRKEHEDFEYIFQLDASPNGIDFFEYPEQIGIEIQGLYWHYGQGGFKISSDIERKIRIESTGIILIYIDEDDALRDPVYYLREALQTRDHSRAARGG
jgi:hypothetical protein